MWLFFYRASCNLANLFPVDFSVNFRPFLINKSNNFQSLSAYWCILLIHIDNVHFGNRLVMDVWLQSLLWKICKLSKLEIDFGALFSGTCHKAREILLLYVIDKSSWTTVGFFFFFFFEMVRIHQHANLRPFLLCIPKIMPRKHSNGWTDGQSVSQLDNGR